MRDYGLNFLTQMYSGPSEAEKRNQEFARLQQIQTFYDNERKKKEEAALKMQLYDENVAKFADQLLAPDRNRIYQKSRILKSSIREMIKENGGDMQAFLANGGHDVMANYKSSIIQSKSYTIISPQLLFDFQVDKLKQMIEVFAQQSVHRQVEIFVAFLDVSLVFWETSGLESLQLTAHLFFVLHEREVRAIAKEQFVNRCQ